MRAYVLACPVLSAPTYTYYFIHMFPFGMCTYVYDHIYGGKGTKPLLSLLLLYVDFRRNKMEYRDQTLIEMAELKWETVLSKMFHQIPNLKFRIVNR